MHNYQFNEKDLFRYKHSLSGVVQEFYKQRLQKYVSGLYNVIQPYILYQILALLFIFCSGKYGYGKNNPNSTISKEDADKIDLPKFDEDDSNQHQEKCLISFGLRRNSKYTMMNINQIGNGCYHVAHPLFRKMERWGLSHPDKNKRIWLSLSNTNFQECEEDFGRFLVLSDGKFGTVKYDVGGAIEGMIAKLSESKKTNRVYRHIHKNGRSFCNNTHFGKTRIIDGMHTTFKRMGIANWEILHPHVLRNISSLNYQMIQVLVSKNACQLLIIT